MKGIRANDVDCLSRKFRVSIYDYEVLDRSGNYVTAELDKSKEVVLVRNSDGVIIEKII